MLGRAPNRDPNKRDYLSQWERAYCVRPYSVYFDSLNLCMTIHIEFGFLNCYRF